MKNETNTAITNTCLADKAGKKEYKNENGNYIITTNYIHNCNVLIVAFSISALFIFIERFMVIQRALKEKKILCKKNSLSEGNLNVPNNIANPLKTIARMIGKGLMSG